jgi:hypothetical protein
MEIKEQIIPLTVDDDGAVVMHLDTGEANADWMRANRLLEAGKTKELEELDAKPMHTIQEA